MLRPPATAIAPSQLDDGGPCLLVTLSTGEVLATRKLVLATGQDGTGEWWMPDFVNALPADRRGNNERVYVFAEATQSIEPMQAATSAASAAKP